MHNALVILLTEILVMTKRIIWLMTSYLLNILFRKDHVFMTTFLIYIEYQNFTRMHTDEIILPVFILFGETNCFLNMANMLTAVKEGKHSYWDKVYSRSSFNQIWILKYWIFWIIVFIVLFQKFRLSTTLSNTYLNDMLTVKLSGFPDMNWRNLFTSTRR